MPQIYDPSRTDPTFLLFKGVQRYFLKDDKTIDAKSAESALARFWNEDPRYKKMHEEYKANNKEMPQVVLQTDCVKRYYFMMPDVDFSYFQGSYQKEDNKVYLCLNFIRDYARLKENFDRELSMAYDYNIKNKNLDDNDDFSCSQIRACAKQYETYRTKSNDNVIKELSLNCAKYLIKNRGPNPTQMPFDIWGRYANKMANKYESCYYKEF